MSNQKDKNKGRVTLDEGYAGSNLVKIPDTRGYPGGPLAKIPNPRPSTDKPSDSKPKK